MAKVDPEPVKEKIGLILSTMALLAAIGGPLTAWGAVQARLEEVENKSEKNSDNSFLTAKHEALIPTLQQDVKDIKTNQSSMANKIDNQYDSIQRDIKQILSAVKA